MLKKSDLKIICALAITIGICSLIGIITLVVLWQTKLTPFQDYSLVIDAGSTHSKIFVYTWPADKSDGYGLTSRVHQVKSCTIPYGPITTIVNTTQEHVKKYFDSAMADCINEIPLLRRSRALIFFGATAGLRLLEITNSSYIHSLLNSIRTYFDSLGLLFRASEQQVRIISGSEEGLSGWISTNILMRELFENNKPLETYGVSDIGGASTQISFIAPNASKERYSMDLFNTTYDVYSHSYLCYGLDQARLVYQGQLIKTSSGTYAISDPCLQSGFIQSMTYKDLFSTPCVHGQYAPSDNLNTSSIFSFVGTGDYEACTTAMKRHFNKLSCSSVSCSFDGVYQPVPVSSALKFIGIAAWYSVFRNIAPSIPLLPNEQNNYEFTRVNLSQIKDAIKIICDQPWVQVHKPDKYRALLCFNAMFQWTLFEYGYSLNNENLKKFQIIKKFNSNEIGWTLGYMINQTNYLQPQYRPMRLLSLSEFIGLLNLCLILFIISSAVTIITIYSFRNTTE